MRAAADVAGAFNTGHARHVDIDKTHVGPMRFELLDSFPTVARSRKHRQLRPRLRSRRSSDSRKKIHVHNDRH